MKYFLLLAGAALVLYACKSSTTNPTQPNNNNHNALDTTSGAAIFARYCAVCHGDSAQGLLNSGVAIQQDSAHVSQYLQNGGAIMPAFTYLSANEAQLLKIYLMQFALPTDGAGLYNRYCATCHGDSAQGMIGLGVGIQQDSAHVSQYLQSGGTTMPKFANFSAGDIQQIKNYLMTFPLPLTGDGLYLRFCATCHATDGLGTTSIAPGIAGDTNVWSAVHNGYGGGRKGNGTMAAISQVTQAQSNLIGSYIGTMTVPTNGQVLFNSYCQFCHTNKNLEANSAQGLLNTIHGGDDGMPQFYWLNIGHADSLYGYMKN